VIRNLRANDLRNKQVGRSKRKLEDNIKVVILKVKIEEVMSRFSWLGMISSGFFEKDIFFSQKARNFLAS